MMNNTLEEKKENILSNDPVEEEWMSKPADKMTDDEKAKFEHFKIQKQKFEEEALKLKKRLEQDLNKLREKIAETCTNFDQKLLVLFNKRLEYQYRIYEQENYIIKLMQSVQSEKTYRSSLKSDYERLNIIQNNIVENRTNLAALENTESDLDLDIKRRADTIPRLIKLGRVDLGTQFDPYVRKLENEKKAMQEFMEENLNKFKQRHPELNRRVVESDLYNEIENNYIKKQAVYDVEAYQPDIEEMERNKKGELKDNQTYFEKFSLAVESKVKIRKEEAEVAKIVKIIESTRRKEEELSTNKRDIEEDINRHASLEYLEQNNIYIEMRFLKRMVEVPIQLSFLVLEDAVLSEGYIINRLNEEIITRGNNLVKNLQKSLKDEFNVKQIEFDVQKSQLEIEDLILESMAITRLKVTRKLHAAINEEKEDEKEEKNLEDQIKTLKKTRDKRIEDMELKRKGMKKEIESIKLQNDTLTAEGAKLEDAVKQREKIFIMMKKKTDLPEEEVHEDEHKTVDKTGKHPPKPESNLKDNQAYKKAMYELLTLGKSLTTESYLTRLKSWHKSLNS